MAITFLPSRMRDTDRPKPPRRQLSPAAEMRMGEQWRIRLGLIATALLMLGSSAAVLKWLPHP